MYITNIRLVGKTSVILPIHDATMSSSYILQSVDGLGPPEIDVSLVNTVDEGGLYRGRRSQNRQFVFRIKLNPDYTKNETVSELRQRLYTSITSGVYDHVMVELRDGNTVLANSKGYVKRFEISPFTQKNEVQITIDCDSPYLWAPLPKNVDITKLDRLSPTFNVEGDAPTFIRMGIEFTASAELFYIGDINATRSLKLLHNFVSGDLLTIDMRPGLRSIFLRRNNMTVNLISALKSDTHWFPVTPGQNALHTSPTNLPWKWSFLQYQARYWGI